MPNPATMSMVEDTKVMTIRRIRDAAMRLSLAVCQSSAL